ncbi:hypothetical protein BDF20DRAFT_833680 [Mycotypha africana]|uniref:uncharacterized protein n=1 Tax=Mycotypha africana TaxID=64632 RepID=UPI0022FFDC26|nr:uncharacterized protein BDF20DRAFT_833680 [Mycotypha africana]KAI8984152.1 hypothetical protein BDF20DRAFT_833680 [Mycotypha africana]
MYQQTGCFTAKTGAVALMTNRYLTAGLHYDSKLKIVVVGLRRCDIVHREPGMFENYCDHPETSTRVLAPFLWQKFWRFHLTHTSRNVWFRKLLTISPLAPDFIVTFPIFFIVMLVPCAEAAFLIRLSIFFMFVHSMSLQFAFFGVMVVGYRQLISFTVNIFEKRCL